jgi:membrane protease YdiL (CAAX protease family)
VRERTRTRTDGAHSTRVSSTKRLVARHPVAAFLVIGIGAGLVAVAIPPLVDSTILPFDMPLYGVAGGILGVALGAFLVTGMTTGRAGVTDLTRRSLRWRVPVRWYLIALLGVPVGATLLALAIYGPEALQSPSAGWPRALAEVAAVFVLQLLLFQLAEEVGFTGFLQDRWQDRYSPLRLSAYIAFLWALWHVPDFFGDEGWGLEQLVSAPVFLAVEFVALFFARVLIVWLYARTGRSVLLVAIFHAGFDASISELSHDVVPGSNAARFLIFSAVIVLAATAVIVVTRGRFAGGSAARHASAPVTRPHPARGAPAPGPNAMTIATGEGGAELHRLA